MRGPYFLGPRKMSGRNSLTILKPAVAANEMPALYAILSTPFQLGGPQMLEVVQAPSTPATLETENVWRPSGCLAVNVLTRA